MTGTLSIAPVTAANRDAAFAFHQASLGEFLLPLAPETFRHVVDARQLFALEQPIGIAGLCYVKPDSKHVDDVPRWELGGLYLADTMRGLGLGVALSMVAIAAVTHADPKPIMAYVHQDHRDPLGLAIHRLGFVPTRQTIRLGPDEARGFLRRDAAGFAVADVLRLPEAALTRVADWLEGFDGSVAGRDAHTSLRLADGLFPSGLSEIASDLRRTATAEPDG